jgi:hypothetical protein
MAVESSLHPYPGTLLGNWDSWKGLTEEIARGKCRFRKGNIYWRGEMKRQKRN